MSSEDLHSGRAPVSTRAATEPPAGGAGRGVSNVKVGIPREVKNHEYRVAITPAGVHEFTRFGHDVVIESGAGNGSSILDGEFVAAGARILGTADEVWGEADLILKVKEPIA